MQLKSEEKILSNSSSKGTALNTPFCTRFGIDVPILVAPFGPWDEVELAVAAASAGCLASLGTAVRSVPELEHQWATLRDRTDRPFVINHTGRPFNPEAFAATLAFKPAAISFHMGVPRDLIDKAHDRGILWLQRRLVTLREPRPRSRPCWRAHCPGDRGRR